MLRLLQTPLRQLAQRSVYAKTTDFPIYMLESKHKGAVMHFLCEHFPAQDSLMTAMNLDEREIKLRLEDIVDDCLRYPVSFAMYDHDHEIAACKLNTIVDSLHHDKFHGKNQKHYTDKVHKMVDFVDEIEEPLPLHDGGVHKWMKLALICERVDLHHLHLYDRLWKHTIYKAKQLKCEGLSSQVTSLTDHEIRHRLKQMGFEEAYSITHENFLDEEGREMFDQDDHAVEGQLLIKTWLDSTWLSA